VSGDGALPPEPSIRFADARQRASERRARQRARMRPLAWLAIGVVVVPAVFTEPAPALTGTGLAVAAALVAYTAGVVLAIVREQAEAAVLVGAAGIALAALQPHGLVEVAPAVAVFIGARRLPFRAAVAFTGAVILGLDVAIVAGGVEVGQSAAASTLLCLVLAVTARSLRQATESRDEIELLLAQLEDAREAEAEAAAIAERGRIARDLHDVLAHSLSALTIQLEGARLLAKRERATAALGETLDRAAELA
jgi:signal transduction histidine kinase